LTNVRGGIIIKTQLHKRLQGGVQIPTGGKAREPKGRFGVIPKPTVNTADPGRPVWMEEGVLPRAVKAPATLYAGALTSEGG
jgi:hypothetical protein